MRLKKGDLVRIYGDLGIVIKEEETMNDEERFTIYWFDDMMAYTTYGNAVKLVASA